MAYFAPCRSHRDAYALSEQQESSRGTPPAICSSVAQRDFNRNHKPLTRIRSWPTRPCFNLLSGAFLPQADVRNEAGGPAFAFSTQARPGAIRRDRLLELDLLRQRPETQLEKVLRNSPTRSEARVCRQDGALLPHPRLHEGHAGAALRDAGQARDVALLDAHLRSRDRRRQDAAQLRADRPQRRGRAQVARLRAEASRAPLV